MLIQSLVDNYGKYPQKSICSRSQMVTVTIYNNLTSNCSRESLAMSSTSSRPQLDAQQVQKLREIFTIFRILVIGRANAGKTTILRALCNATKEPLIFDPTGKKVKYMVQVHVRYSNLCP